LWSSRVGKTDTPLRLMIFPTYKFETPTESGRMPPVGWLDCR
jgi:hypothetical protein